MGRLSMELRLIVITQLYSTSVKPLTAQEGDQVKIVLRHDSQHDHHYLGRFKISVTDTDKAFTGGG